MGACFLLVPHLYVAASWWEVFESDGLSTTIVQGIEDSPSPQVALARIKAAEAAVKQTQYARQPEARSQIALRAGQENKPATGGETQSVALFAGSARLSWELDVFGRVGSLVDAANAQLAIQEATQEGVLLALSIDIARNWIALAYHAEDVALTEQALKYRSRLWDRVQNRVDNGLLPSTETQELKRKVQRAEQEVAWAKAQYNRTHARLIGLLGGQAPEVTPDTLKDITLPELPDLTRTNLPLQRPDVLRAYYAWVQADEQAQAADQSRLPSLSFVLSLAGESDEGGASEQWEAWAGPVVSLPIWEPSRNATRDRSKHIADARKLQLAEIGLQAASEIDAAWIERSLANTDLSLLQQQLDTVTTLHQTSLRRRNAGFIQEDELLEQSLAHIVAQRTYNRGYYQALMQHLLLIASLGG